MRTAPHDVTTLPAFIHAATSAYKDNTFALYRPRFRTLSWTYGDLWNHSVAFAEIMQKHGVQKGDRIMLAAHNSPYWVATFWGAQLLGALVVPLSPESNEEFLGKIRQQTDAKIFFRSAFATTDRLGETPTITIEEVPKPKTDKAMEPASVDEDDTAEIVYTSGTTGFPKGVMLTHKNLLSNLRDVRQVIPVDETYRLVSILPLFHMYEQMGGMMTPVSAGAQISYAASLNPNHLKWIFHADHTNTMLAVPEFLRLIYLKIMAKAEEEGKKHLIEKLLRLSSKFSLPMRRKLLPGVKIHHTFGWKLHTIASGGAPLEQVVGDFWEGIGIYILQGYGLTETSPLLAVNRYEDRKVRSVGKPVASAEVKIAEDGEVLAKGLNVFKGYWQNEEKTKEAFTDDGWFKTGDIGYFDEDGHLILKGRKKHMIVLPNGEKVHPEDLEEKLNKQEGVIDSAVLGLGNNGSVEVHAVLLIDPAVQPQPKPENIMQAVNRQVMEHQRIRGVSVWPHEDFPRTPTKKVKKHIVEEEIGRLKGSEVKSSESAEQSSALQHIIATALGVSPASVSDTTRLVDDLNIDSLGRIALTAHIEAKFNVSIDETEIVRGITVSDVQKIIRERKHKQVRYEFNQKQFSARAVAMHRLFQPLILKPLSWLFAPMRVHGAEHARDLREPVLVYPNHISPVDAPVIYAAMPASFRSRMAVAAATDVVYERPGILWKIVRFLGERHFAMIPFARTGQIKTSLEYVGRALDANHSVLLFPEGSMSKDGKFQDIKGGAALLAKEMNVPILPVKVEGTRNIVSPKNISRKQVPFPKRAHVSVSIGKPFRIPDEWDEQQTLREIAVRIQRL